MPQEKSQADYRHTLNVADQHGRKWLVTIEKNTMQPTGIILPCFIVPDEHLPPQKYLVYTDNYDAGGRRLMIEYSDWLRDNRERRREYNAAVHAEGKRLRGEGYDPTAKPTQDVLDLVGTPPLDEKVIRSMEKGEPTYLGSAPEEQEAPTRKLCGQCATQIAITAKFCPECGADLASVTAVGRAIKQMRSPESGEFVKV